MQFCEIELLKKINQKRRAREIKLIRLLNSQSLVNKPCKKKIKAQNFEFNPSSLPLLHSYDPAKKKVRKLLFSFSIEFLK